MTQVSSQLQIGELKILLVRKRIRNLNLTVRGTQGRVRISAPVHISEAEIRRFVVSRLDWIRKQQRRLASQPVPAACQYETGEQHFFMGRAYRLLLHATRQEVSGVTLNGDDQLHLVVPPGASIEQRRAVLQDWYRSQLLGRIPGLVAHYEPRMGVQVAEFRIRSMKTRWGSCNTVKRRIWINLELAKLPVACLEYIVVHEYTRHVHMYKQRKAA